MAVAIDQIDIEPAPEPPSSSSPQQQNNGAHMAPPDMHELERALRAHHERLDRVRAH